MRVVIFTDKGGKGYSGAQVALAGAIGALIVAGATYGSIRLREWWKNR